MLLLISQKKKKQMVVNTKFRFKVVNQNKAIETSIK